MDLLELPLPCAINVLIEHGGMDFRTPEQPVRECPSCPWMGLLQAHFKCWINCGYPSSVALLAVVPTGVGYRPVGLDDPANRLMVNSFSDSRTSSRRLPTPKRRPGCGRDQEPSAMPLAMA